ncbi:RNA methyltransferase [Brevundimonas sp. 2R-24]|uniref:RNA methyltransferase n=1 Tax=Peiella sedimenti TaxID=3061083 RepID=A0ABT8SJM2_9CAUL|nr:RNA methyltransferase [Caulobacteraceae bacterium XZ-24]
MSDRIIESLTNPTVKAVRALHMKKSREETGRFLSEGLKFVGEALDLGFSPRILMVGRDARPHPLLERAMAETRNAGGEVIRVTHDILAKVSRKENPQAVVAVFEQRFADLEALKPETAPCWVALEDVRDPGNLGAIIRTADAAGCGAVILVGDCTDPFSVEAVRATMGSVFAVPLVRCTREAFLAWLQTWPGISVGARLDGAVHYRQAAYQAPTLVVMGNEAQGLSPEAAAACELGVKIPMRGRADSLNLAVATGIMIYAVTDTLES